MKYIRKDREVPMVFSDIVNPILSTPGNSGYDSLGNKKPQFLDFLLLEQHNLCAYCNQKITKNSATIEHFICQSHNHKLDLNYHNLFAVCKGNEGIPKTSHCDKYRANEKGNDYFFPFIFFEQCITSSWDKTNPFFDVEFNKKTGVLSGKVIPKEAKANGYPAIKPRIQYAIDTLNLNAPILIEARKAKWEGVLEAKKELCFSWQELFDYYLTNPCTDFHEFVLLAIKRQLL